MFQIQQDIITLTQRNNLLTLLFYCLLTVKYCSKDKFYYIAFTICYFDYYIKFDKSIYISELIHFSSVVCESSRIYELYARSPQISLKIRDHLCCLEILKIRKTCYSSFPSVLNYWNMATL